MWDSPEFFFDVGDVSRRTRLAGRGGFPAQCVPEGEPLPVDDGAIASANIIVISRCFERADDPIRAGNSR